MVVYEPWSGGERRCQDARAGGGDSGNRKETETSVGRIIHERKDEG